MADRSDINPLDHIEVPVKGDATEKQKRGKISPWAALLVISTVLVIAAGGFYILRDHTDSQQKIAPPMVVVLDSTQLAMIRLDRVREQDLDKDQVQQEAQDFAGELGAILAEYEEIGIVVLNKSVVLSAPSQFDITPLVAKRMGLDIGGSAR